MHIVEFQRAANALAIPERTLYNALQSKGLLRADGFIEWTRAAEVVGCPDRVADDVRYGRDWLVSEQDIKNTWGVDPPAIAKIAGPAVFIIDGHFIYRASDFIRFIRMDAAKRAKVLGGPSKNGKPNVRSEKVRGKVQLPYKDNPPRRAGRRASK